MPTVLQFFHANFSHSRCDGSIPTEEEILEVQIALNSYLDRFGKFPRTKDEFWAFFSRRDRIDVRHN